MTDSEVINIELYDELQKKFDVISQNNKNAGDLANIMHRITQQTVKEATAPLTAQLASQKIEVDNLKIEQTLSESRIACLENQVGYLQQQITEMKEYSCSNNIVLDGVRELIPENVELVVRNFLRNDLKFQDEADNILLDDCHRMGHAQGRPRQIIVRFVKRTDKQNVLGRGRELAGSPIHMWEHVPPEVREERRELFKDRRERIEKGERSVKVRGLRLIVGNKVVRDLKKEKGKRIPEPECTNKRAAELMPKVKCMKQSNVRGSVFKSHFLPIDNKADIKPALVAIRAAGQTSGATHNIWAASIGRYRQAWDDREHGAGHRLQQTLSQSGKEGIVVVSRYYGGSHLGEDRFKAISQVGKEAIDAYVV